MVGLAQALQPIYKSPLTNLSEPSSMSCRRHPQQANEIAFVHDLAERIAFADIVLNRVIRPVPFNTTSRGLFAEGEFLFDATSWQHVDGAICRRRSC